MAQYEREPLPRRPEPFPDARETVAQYVAAGCAALPETDTGHAAPDVATVRAVFERATTTRLTKRERANRAPEYQFRMLRNARPRDSIGRVFLQRLQWHTGTGSYNLHSSFFAVFDIGRVNFETVDTIAAVFVHMFTRNGLKHTNTDRWRNLLTGSATWRTDGRAFAERYAKGE